MTPLNTIIEEEKKSARYWFISEYCVKRPAQAVRWIRSIFFDDHDQIKKILESHDRAITTAMQRAYEAGRAQENTPDTGWDKITFENEFAHWWNNKPALTERIEDHIQTLLTSRDTYWKESLKKELLSCVTAEGGDCYFLRVAKDSPLFDNLK